MDTRFWGPSGWCLLHLIAAAPPTRVTKEWFDLLEFVLPCKYCRASFHDYTNLQPLTPAILRSREAFSRWLFDIHNRVNGKLRGQGLLTTPDPSWPSIRDRYFKMQDSLCAGQPFIGWDFMTSVAYSTPAADYKPVPMDDTPEVIPTDLRGRNRYNLLTRQERIAKLMRWWALIPSILPCSAWRAAWKASQKQEPPLRIGKEAVMRWMWRVEERVCTDLKCPTPHPSLPALRRDVSAFESPCGSAKKGRTCRTRKHKARQRVIQTRKRKILAGG
jgi:hypothetical protein